jgi:hypothetical protein
MKRFVTLGLALALAGGCTELFGIEVPPLEQRSTTGGDGGLDAGTAGQATADGGAGQAGAGGSGISGQSAGGRSASGGSDVGGRDAGLSGWSSAGTDMLGGTGGALGAACTHPGRLACARAGSPERLLCAGGAWVKTIPCNTGETCDRRGGACGQVFPGCANPDDHVCVLENAVDGFYLLTCGPDLLSAELVPCPFGCETNDETKDDHCNEPTDGQLILERPPVVTTDLAFWPGPTIPVCFVNPSDGPAAAIRDEIDRTWGRFGGISFSGWGECSEELTGVTVKFVALREGDECVDELGGIDRIGYPGATGTVNVTLCRRFTDAKPSGRIASEALLRLVARHEFGHVLGFDDVVKDYNPFEFMARAIDEDRLDGYEFDTPHAARLQIAYGRKPAGALVDTLGNCLTITGGTLSFDHCDGSAEQTFYLENGQLSNAGGNNCLHADASSGVVDLADCVPAGSLPPAEQLWRADAVDVVGFGGYCPSSGDDLFNCVGDPVWMLWSPDLVDGGRRIRLRMKAEAYDYCARVVAATNLDFARYVLKSDVPCDDCMETDPECNDPDRFEFTASGQLEIDGQCLAIPVTGAPEGWGMPGLGGVEVVPCASQPRMIWNLSGRFANAAGRVLSRSTSGTPTLVTRPIEDEPSPNDILDFYLSKAE